MNDWLFSSAPPLSTPKLPVPAPDSPRELHVLGHDGDSLGVDGAQVGILEETHDVTLGSLAQRGPAGRRGRGRMKVEGNPRVQRQNVGWFIHNTRAHYIRAKRSEAKRVRGAVVCIYNGCIKNDR